MNRTQYSSLLLQYRTIHTDRMFDVHCPVCDQRYLVGSRSITSFHNTSDGPIAYLACPAGHHLVRYFRQSETKVGVAT